MHHRLAILALLLATPAPLLAQGVITGIVRDDSTGAPLPGAEILINFTNLRAVTAANGRYLLSGVPAGRREAIIRLVGYVPIRTSLILTDGDTLRVNATLVRSEVALAPIIVTGEAPGSGGMGREGFEERKRLGMGLHFDSTTMRRNEHRDVGDLLQGRPGVAVSPRLPGGGYHILSSRSRDPLTGRFNCYMQVYLDGVPVGRGGKAGTNEVRPESTRIFEVASLESMEVYRSAAEVPPEYGGATGGCGVVLLWSRRGQ